MRPRFEGIDGAGETTQIELLEAALQAHDSTVFVTGVFCTRYGQAVRSWLMDVDRMAQASLRSQVFLLGSAMSQLVDEIACAIPRRQRTPLPNSHL